MDFEIDFEGVRFIHLTQDHHL